MQENREAFFRLLMEVAYDGVLITQDGVIVEVSHALSVASGFPASELIGKPVTDFVAEEFRDGIRQQQEDRMDGRYDVVAVAKDGRHLMVEAVTRTFVIDGRVSRISALRDVTEKRRLEAQSYRAQRMEALASLAGGIAHDFNNILTIIRSYAAMLAEDLDEPQRCDALGILAATEMGASLTRQLLAFGRPLRSRPAVELDLSALVRESAQMLQLLIGRHIELETDLAPDLESIMGDPSQIQQVILNLVINARDAMVRGGHLLVRTRNANVAESHRLVDTPVRPGPYVMLAIKDSGSGMSDEVRAQIFEPFFTTKGPDRGTGLGLAIVRGIVERSRGFIEVESTPGIGSTFAVYIPAIRDGSVTR